MQAPHDSRNLIDAYKGKSIDAIVADLDTDAISLEIALDNVSRDYNMGTIVRSSNAFGVRHVHIIGSRQWNKRGAMMTDKYLHVHYYANADSFVAAMRQYKKRLIAVDNCEDASLLSEALLPEDCVLLFGAEGPGISEKLRNYAEQTVAIEQFGSTRSINVGVAAGIAMYAWLQQHVLN